MLSTLILLPSLLSLVAALPPRLPPILPPRAVNTSTSPVPVPAGFSLTFADDFSQPGPVNGNTWKFDLGTKYPNGPEHWGTGEIQEYTADARNIFISQSGNLNIVPTHDATTGKWSSARIETRRDGFNCTAGGQMIMEANIKLPQGGNQLGHWAAFWAMGKAFRDQGPYSWPGIGEWDVMEAVNGADTIVGTLHCGTYPGGPCNEPIGRGSETKITRGVFNKYSLKIDRTAAPQWQNEFLAWSLNGREYHKIKGSDIANQTAWEALVHKPFFILFNVAMGGGFPNAVAKMDTPVANTTSGIGMEVDYVAVYNKF
ncbi:Beta-glucanase [Orbilia brochopaga]|nr:Beta-glucanase [Drechslerella brochopaga]